jgi:organic radical activating enzyme
MHSTTAPLNSLEQYKKTAQFIDKYYSIYSKHHRKNWNLMISFTGGEPAVNPAFFDLLSFLKENYPYMKLNLTTNGTWNERKGKFLLDHLDSITVSYHCEGTQKQKDLVRHNLKWVRNTIKNPSKLKVNVMMHQDYFDECVDLIENFLKPNDIKYIPRVIGDDNKFKSKWFEDMDGAMRRTSHTYTFEQLDYLKNHWNKKNQEAANANFKKQKRTNIFDYTKDNFKTKKIIEIKVDNSPINVKKVEEIVDMKEIVNVIKVEDPIVTKKIDTSLLEKSQPKAIEIKTEVTDGLARKMGRMCCGGRCMTVKDNGEIKNAAFIEQSNFKGYNCMVNWFFLHIEEDKNAVYHHQTCMAKLPNTPEVDIDMIKFTKAKFTNEVGPITSLTESDRYLEWLEKQFENGRTPTIICPNTHCGCGICVTKASNELDFREIANKFIKLGETI